jgi:tetratricopeptide (TPR) repeat protein
MMRISLSAILAALAAVALVAVSATNMSAQDKKPVNAENKKPVSAEDNKPASAEGTKPGGKDEKLVSVVGGRFPTSTYSRKHRFPGVGDYKQWEAADKLCVEAGKLDDFGRVKQARAKYAEAIGIYPHDMDFFNSYGMTLLKLHDDVGAETAWRYTLSQKKGFWPAQNNLGRLLFVQSRLPEAKYMWTKASENDPPREVLEAITINIGLCDRKLRALRGYPDDDNASAGGGTFDNNTGSGYQPDGNAAQNNAGTDGNNNSNSDTTYGTTSGTTDQSGGNYNDYNQGTSTGGYGDQPR